ncbi:MAG: ABC transporter permease [Clostridia bacterium]|nr:ABC transporter permease [Clostridia bacterium]
MLRYVIKRLLILIPVFLCIAVILFGVAKMMPGDPVRAMLPSNLKHDQYQMAYDAMYRRLGLDKSIPEQFFAWFFNMLRGEFGWSSMNNRPVIDVIAEPMRNTVILNIGVIFLQLLIAIPVGIRCAVKRMSVFDNAWQVFSLIFWSMPSFFLSLCFLYLFSIHLGWLPFGGMPSSVTLSGWAYFFAWIRHMVLPATVLALISIAYTIRIVRNSMIDALNQDYIRTARAKGLKEKTVIYSHAFRNALIPISTVVVFTIFSLFSGSPVTESVFAWHGIGRMLIQAVMMRDTMLIVTLNAFFAVISLVAVLVADIVYGLVDPRVRLS